MKEEYPGVDCYAVDTIEEAVKDEDIVSVSTSSPTGDPELYPYIAESWIKPGAIIETTAALRFDDDFIINRARTVPDNIKLYEAWEEEYAPKAYNTVPIPAVHVEDLIAEGKMKAEQVDDLGGILMGNIPVHRKEGEIVIYSVGGMLVEDVAWGTIVYRNALERCSSGLFVLKKKISLRVEWIYAILSMDFLHLHINKKKMLIHLEPVLIY